MLDALTEGILVRDADGKVITLNSAAQRILGLSIDQLNEAAPLDPDWALVTETDTPDRSEGPSARTVLDVLEGASEGGLRVCRPSGDVSWIEASSQTLADEDGQPLRLTVISDVTANRDMKRELDKARLEKLAMTEAAPIGMFTTDTGGRSTYVNPQWLETFGITRAQASGRGWISAIHPDDRDDVAAEVNDAATQGRDFHMHFRALHEDGSIRWVRANSRALNGLNGEAVGHVGTAEDVTDEMRGREEIQAAERRYRVAFENAPLAMTEVDRDGTVLSANAATSPLLGRPISAITGASICTLLGLEDLDALRAAGQDPLVEAGTHAVPHRVTTPNGNDRWVLLRAASLGPGAGPGKPAMVIQMVDLTERLRFEDRLRHLADHDPLTGMMNRRSFSKVLDRHVARVKRHGAIGVLLLIDLDNFKAVNDTLGHSAGDQVITAVAEALRGRFRKEDFIARLGGDEFAILAPDCPVERAHVLARAALSGIRRRAITLPDGQVRRVTASVGAAVFDESSVDGEERLTKADIAMYDAKDAGRDCYVLANSEDQSSRIGSAISWIGRIEAALDEGDLELYAQPIIELESGEVSQHELLIRLIGEGGERIPPGPWMAVAESTGLVRKIDRWVCEKAIDLLAETTDTVYEVNLSGVSLGDNELLNLIGDRLTSTGVDPSRLIIEVTETAAIANLGAAQLFISELQGLGCRFALDDFGAGFGSFYYLKYLPFDFVKIDGEFVRNCDTNSADRSIIRSIVDIANELNTRVVAEHVQTTEVLDTVVSLGVSHAQGFLLGAPAPALELAEAANTN